MNPTSLLLDRDGSLRHMQARIRYYWLPILSGILIGTSYIPFPPWALLFLFVPLWTWWLKQTNWKKIFLGGWLTQAILTLIGFNWVAYTIHEFGHLPWPVAVLALFLFCSFAHLHVPLAGLLWWSICRLFNLPLKKAIWLLPATHIVSEQLYPMIFDWNMGYTLLSAKMPAAQVAELIGFRGLSGFIFVVNAAVLVLWQQRKSRTHLWWQKTAALAVILVGINVLGLYLHHLLPPPDLRAKVLLVQANIGNLEKQEAEYGDSFRGAILQSYIHLTEQGLSGQGSEPQKPDFVVWPETAFPHLLTEPYFSNQGYAQELRLFLQKRNISLATGGYGYSNDEPAKLLNSFYTINSDGNQTDAPYSKTRLLAFGEYLPGADLLPFLSQWIPQVGSFGRGQGPTVMTLGNYRLGPLICYESLFDDFSRALANKGTQILVNVTNDSWYGKWQEPWQHMYMTLARAIEVRRPMVRVTNTGFTTVMLADGTILERSPLHQEWQHLYNVDYSSTGKTTWFMGWGFYFSSMLSLCLLFFTLWRNRFARAS